MKRTIHTVFLGALAAGMLGCASVRTPQVPPGASVRVLSYNVHAGLVQRSNTLAVVLESKADLVVMQESTSTWIQFMKQELGGTYPHIQSSYARRFGFSNGFSILSKWPCKEIAFIDDTNSFYGAWLVEIQSPMGQILVLSVHLAAPVDQNGRPGMESYFRTQGERRGMIERYYAHVSPGLPLIVLGDFNEGGGGEAVAWLEKQGLTDALPLYERMAPTWRGSIGPIPLRLRLDHILFSSDLACYSSGVMEGGGSDHLAVWADLGLVSDDPLLSANKKKIPSSKLPELVGVLRD